MTQYIVFYEMPDDSGSALFEAENLAAARLEFSAAVKQAQQGANLTHRTIEKWITGVYEHKQGDDVDSDQISLIEHS